MSIKLMTLAWELPLDPTEKLVLLSLADWVNEDAGRNVCWPSIETLARKCHTSETTIKRCIRSLEAAGHVTRELRAGESTRYHVHPKTSGDVTEQHGTPRGVNLTRVAHDPPGGSPTAPNTEEIQKPSRAKALSGARAKPKLSFEQSFPNDVVIHAFRVQCVQWAAQELGWRTSDAGLEYERFRDGALAHDRHYADWGRAWQNWCRSDYCKTTAPKREPFRG